MLAIKGSAGVTPEVNLRNPLHASNGVYKESTLVLNPGQTSSEVQNRVIIRKNSCPPKNF